MKLEPECEEWIINFIRRELRFMPSTEKCSPFLPFSINQPFAVYDISRMTREQIGLLYELAPQALQNCLKPGYKIYAVDWYHNVILYDPLEPEGAHCAHPGHLSHTKSGLGYYEGFFPDGDTTSIWIVLGPSAICPTPDGKRSGSMALPYWRNSKELPRNLAGFPRQW